MEITVKDVEPCRKALEIVVPAAEVATHWEQAVKQFQGQARIPGFRPGRAPRDVVLRRFKKELQEHVKDQVMPAAYRDALKTHKLDVVAVLNVVPEPFVEGQPFKFTVTLDVPPDFAPPEYKGVPVNNGLKPVAEPAVDEALAQLRERHATFEEIKDAAAEKGDVLQIRYEGVCEARPVAELAPAKAELGKAADVWTSMDENEMLPGFTAALLGARAGEKRQVLVDFPADFWVPELAGKKATYFVDVVAVRRKHLPEMDAEFLGRFKVETLDQLRVVVRKELERQAEIEEKDRRRTQIIDYLLKSVVFDLPQSVVDEETRKNVFDIVRNATTRGVPEEVIQEKKDDIFSTAARDAAAQVRLDYILHRLATLEHVEVEDAELEDTIRMYAYRRGMEPAKLRADLEADGRIDHLREHTRRHKMLDFILNNAKVVEAAP